MNLSLDTIAPLRLPSYEIELLALAEAESVDLARCVSCDEIRPVCCENADGSNTRCERCCRHTGV